LIFRVESAIKSGDRKCETLARWILFDLVYRVRASPPKYKNREQRESSVWNNNTTAIPPRK
jgi:hypothetical protein